MIFNGIYFLQEKKIMKVYIVVECFKGEKTPEIKGVYKDRTTAEEIKNNYRLDGYGNLANVDTDDFEDLIDELTEYLADDIRIPTAETACL